LITGVGIVGAVDTVGAAGTFGTDLSSWSADSADSAVSRMISSEFSRLLCACAYSLGPSKAKSASTRFRAMASVTGNPIRCNLSRTIAMP
jgi:hypothetical protein